jgi:SnoaL-like domain
METWEIEARLSIQQTMARYTHAGDSGRSQDFAEAFTVDGVLEVYGEGPNSGHQAIAGFLEAQKASLAGAMDRRLIRHFVSSLRIDFPSPEEANASSYFLAVTEIGPDHWGRYRDRLVPVDGEWLIAQRFIRVDGAMPGSWQAEIGASEG